MAAQHLDVRQLASRLNDSATATVDTSDQEFRAAAVVLPLLLSNAQASVLEADVVLTLRGHHLRHHAGQVALPGGRQDPEDISLMHAALREFEEELGVQRVHLDVLGAMTPVHTPTRYHVLPFVAAMIGEYEWRPDPTEVEAVFRVPIALLRDETAWQWQEHHFDDFKLVLPHLYVEDFDVWGVTAGILREFCRVLDADT